MVSQSRWRQSSYGMHAYNDANMPASSFDSGMARRRTDTPLRLRVAIPFGTQILSPISCLARGGGKNKLAVYPTMNVKEESIAPYLNAHTRVRTDEAVVRSAVSAKKTPVCSSRSMF